METPANRFASHYLGAVVESGKPHPDLVRLVGKELADRWRTAEVNLTLMLDSMGAGDGSTRFELGLLPIQTSNPTRTIAEVESMASVNGACTHQTTFDQTTEESTIWAMPTKYAHQAVAEST